MRIEIKRASELEENTKKKMSEIFVDGFGKDLTFFSKDKEKLVNALEHMFVDDVFYCALIDGEMAGIIVISILVRALIQYKDSALWFRQSGVAFLQLEGTLF